MAHMGQLSQSTENILSEGPPARGPFSLGAHMTPTQTITLDLSRRQDSPQRVTLGQGDRNGTTLRVLVTDDGEPFDCAGLTPYLMVWCGGSVRQGGTASGNVATIPVDESAFGDWHGTTGNAYVSLESDDMATSTQRFSLTMLRAAAIGPGDGDGQDDKAGTGLGMAAPGGGLPVEEDEG